MPKKDKSRNNRIILGLILSMMIMVLAIFGRVAGENFMAKVDIDLGDILNGVGVGIETDDLKLNIGGGNNSQPGCGSSNCLVVPPTSAYSGIATETSFRQALINWTNFFLKFLTLISMIALVYAGFLYITAAGNDEQMNKAKKAISWVVIGIVVILLAYSLVNTLITTGPTGSDI